jgi:S-adenosylmethionine synthetase
MTTTFMGSPSLVLTSESVTEGHPDKMCDQISDAVLDDILKQDPMGRVACETAITTGLVVVMGEITTQAYSDIPALVRDTVQRIGYTNAHYGFDYETCGVIVSIKEQSGDIAMGVNKALEAKQGTLTDALDTGAGDQGMMMGFACNETPELMPMTISLAHRLCRQLALLRKSGELQYLRPDGKSQVTIEYEYGRPKRIDTVVISTQHDDNISTEALRSDVLEQVIKPILPPHLVERAPRTYINPTGRFVIGGPMGDAGVTGRKIIVDSYGGIARHGGGAFSGKDPTKVVRSGAYAARFVGKNVVAGGLAERIEVQLSYAIGVAEPTSIAVETFGTGRIPDGRILELVRAHFDLRPAAIIKQLDLRRPIYQATAAYGHFGRDDIDAPWERTDKAAALAADAGVEAVAV